MIVTVNGQEMDLTLEDEQSVGELLAGIEGWLEQNGRSLSGFSVDGVPVPASGLEAACGRSLDSVERVDVRASTWSELAREAFCAAADAVETADGADAWASSPAGTFLAGRAPDVDALVRRALAGDAAAAAEAASAARDRIREIDDPRAEFAALAARLEPVAARLEDLPLALQTGRDAAAAATLHDFSLLAGKLLRLVPLLRQEGLDLAQARVGDEGFEAVLSDLDAALRELVGAYEAGDAVLVGDLAEYELATRLRALSGALGPIAAA